MEVKYPLVSNDNQVSEIESYIIMLTEPMFGVGIPCLLGLYQSGQPQNNGTDQPITSKASISEVITTVNWLLVYKHGYNVYSSACKHGE